MERQLVWPEWEGKHFFLSLGTPRDVVAFMDGCSGAWEKKRAFSYFSRLGSTKISQKLGFAPREF